MNNRNRIFTLVGKKDIADNVVSLSFKPEDGHPFEYRAGQHIDITLEKAGGQSRSYTLSSSPQEPELVVTVKRTGRHSSVLCDLNRGEQVIVDGPWGSFYPSSDNQDIVMIAGGIGITPFYSIIKDRLLQDQKNKVSLLYSNKTITGAAFLPELIQYAKSGVLAAFVHFLTQQSAQHEHAHEYSRINKELLQKHIKDLPNKQYYVCGSVSFTNDIWRMLKELGVPAESLFTESFY